MTKVFLKGTKGQKSTFKKHKIIKKEFLKSTKR